MAGGRPSHKDILEFLSDADSPDLSTVELAEVFGYSQPGMRKRMYKLEEMDLVETRETGGVRLWWITSKGVEYLDGPD